MFLHIPDMNGAKIAAIFIIFFTVGIFLSIKTIELLIF